MSSPTTLISMAIGSSDLDSSKLPIVGSGPYHQVRTSPAFAQNAKGRATRDDFSVDLKESVVIDICKREQIVNQNVAKILNNRLGDRNSAAHPSTIHVGQLQAEAFIEDIVDNVVLALKT